MPFEGIAARALAARVLSTRPAWHHDDDRITDGERQSWGDWRGYGIITTKVGGGDGPVTTTESTYFRGMWGDKTTAGLPDGVIAARLGHDETVMRTVYGVPHASEQAQAAQVMERLLG